MLFEIMDRQTALNTILRRKPLELGDVPPLVQARIQAGFGEALSPLQAVQRVLADVRREGDPALRAWTARLDGVDLERFRVPQADIDAAVNALPRAVLEDLRQAAERVENFHRQQPLTSWITQSGGGTLGQLVRPIRRVGLYVPGGTAPLPSTVLMSAVPARVAGVQQIALVSPPRREDGKVAPVILAAASVAGVDEVYALGGAQAVAALAYGTRQVPAVDKIFGPGNLFVTLAKREVFGVVGIDGLAGPTETMVIADDSARPDWVALDLLAQAEHDILASAILLTPSRRLAELVQRDVLRMLDAAGADVFSRAQVISAALAANGGIVLTRYLEEALELANLYAPEHLSLSVAEPWRWVERVQAAGGIFLGERSFEVLGDYAAGPSHVMPTGGTARFASPLNVWDFVRLVSLVGLDPRTSRQVAAVSARLARVEGLDAHARAAEARTSI